MRFLERFSEWAAGIYYDDLPASVQSLARQQLANQVAAACGGYVNGGKALTENLLQACGEGPCTLLGGHSVGPVDATYLHSTFSMMHDYDDYLFMAHSGHGSVFTALAVGEIENRSGEELLTAIVIGNELAGRLAGSTLLGPHNGQMWSFVHQATSAAITARLISREPDRILDAVALSLFNPPFPNIAGFMDGHAKYSTAAAPAATGLRAGLLAESGAGGNPDVLAGDAGFLNDFAYQPLPVMSGLGDTWVTKSICFKPYPGCAYLQSPLQAFEDVDDVGDPLRPGDVRKITVRGPLPTIMMEGHCDAHRSSDRLVPTNVAFSVKLALAVRILEGEYRTEFLTDEFLGNHRQKLRDVAGRITVEHDWQRTLKIIEGVSRAVDLGSLAEEVGYVNILGALRSMRDRHSSLSTGLELFNLIVSGQVFSLREVFESPLDWEGFDFSKARMGDLKFNFGCELNLRTRDGSERQAVVDRHTGSAGSDADETRDMVYEKLHAEASDYYSGENHARELASTIKRVDQVSVRSFTEKLNR